MKFLMRTCRCVVCAPNQMVQLQLRQILDSAPYFDVKRLEAACLCDCSCLNMTSHISHCDRRCSVIRQLRMAYCTHHTAVCGLDRLRTAKKCDRDAKFCGIFTAYKPFSHLIETYLNTCQCMHSPSPASTHTHARTPVEPINQKSCILVTLIPTFCPFSLS